MKTFDTSGQLLVALGIDTGTSNTLSVLSNAVSVLSQSVSVLSQNVSALSQRQSVLSQAVSVLSNQVSVLSQAVSALSQQVSVLSNAVSVISNALSALSQAVSVLSNAVSVISVNAGTIRPLAPGGRLTFQTSTPVMVTPSLAALSLVYTPYKYDVLPIYKAGTTSAWVLYQPGQITMSLDSSVHVSSTNYDVFAVNDGGTVRIGSGPAWASNSARALSLAQKDGIYTNMSIISALRYGSLAVSAVSVNTATYLGTFRTTGAPGQSEYSFGSLALSGVAANLNLWNMYNRVLVHAIVKDATDNWTYQTNAWRAANNSAQMRASFVRGLDEDAMWAAFTTHASAGAASDSSVGIGLDSVTAEPVGDIAYTGNTSFVTKINSFYVGIPGLGFHFLTALEKTFSTANPATFYGDSGIPTALQNSFQMEGWF